MDPSIEIPALNCSLNAAELINMTSNLGRLQIFGTTLMLEQSIQFMGFELVEFINITINCQIYAIISDSIIQFTNSILQSNSNFIAERIHFNNSVVQSMIFQNRIAFEVSLSINGLKIQDSAFIHSTFCPNYFEMSNILMENVQFIDSTFGFVEEINNLTITSSYIHSSQLFQSQIVNQVSIHNTNLILSVLFNSSGVLDITVSQMFIENSQLLVMKNENQVLLKNVIISNVRSDSNLIYVESPYLYINGYNITNLSCLANFYVFCKNVLINNSIFSNLIGNVVISDKNSETTLLLNLFNISSSQCNNILDISGILAIKNGYFSATNCSLITSSLSELSIDQSSYSKLISQNTINLTGVNVVQIKNVVISDCEDIIFTTMNNVMNAKLQNISIVRCTEFNFLTLHSTSAFISDILFTNIQNFDESLTLAINSQIQLKRINFTNIISVTGVMSYRDSKVINISSVIATNLQQCKSLIQLENIYQAIVSKSVFTNSSIQTGTISIDSSNFSAFNNKFSQINAIYGSAFYCINSSLKIFNNSFQNLVAEQQGGAIYYQQQINNTYYIQENNQSECAALIGNYIYLETNQISLKDNNYYTQGPVFIRVQNTTYSIDGIIRKNNQITIDNYKSGQLMTFDLSILGSEEQILCYFSEDLLLENQTFHFNQCYYKIEYRRFEDSPRNQSLYLQMQLNQLTLEDKPLTFTILLNMRDCDIGEQWIQNTCQICEPGSYSLSSKDPCLQCFTEAHHCPGGATIDLRQGYWRPHNLTDLIEPCNSHRSVCNGGAGNFTCGTGFIGALCEDCDYYGIIWKRGYARNYQGICVECDVSLSSLLQAFAMLLWIILVLYFSVSGALRMAKSQLIGHYLRILGWHFGIRSTMVIDQTEVLFKMISTYLQLLSILIVVNVSFPQPFHNITKLIGNPLQIFGFQIECFLLHFPIEIVYLRQIGNLVVSVVLITLFIFGYFIHSLCFVQYYSMSAVFINTIIQVYFFFLQDLIEGLFEVLFCLDASGQQYIQASTQYICHTADHLLFIKSFVIPALIIIGVIMPLYFVLKLYKNKGKLWNCSVRLPYGYLFMEYRIYYWEFLRFGIKFLFSLFSTLLIQEFKLMFLFAILILLLYQEILYQAKPFIEFKYNSLDKIGTQIQILNFVLVYMQDENSNETTSYLITFIFSILNMAFILYFIYKISLELLKGYIKILEQKLVALLDNCPLLQKCIKKPQPSSLPIKIAYLWKNVRQYVYALIEEQRKMQLTITQNDMLTVNQNRSNDISTINESQFHSKLSDTINSSLKLPKTVASIHQLTCEMNTATYKP